MLPLHNKVFLLSRRWNHHSNHSGYDLLGNFVGTTLTSKPIANILLPDHLFWKMTKNMTGYDRVGAALELLAIKHMAVHKQCVFHFLYGENTFNYSGYFNGTNGHKIIATFHHPPQKLASLIGSPKRLKKLSGAVVVSQNQINSEISILPNNQIYFIPHPVDTSFFTPSEQKKPGREHNTCLFVGAHLRDFDTLYSVIENAWIISPGIKFYIVILPKYNYRLRGMKGNYKIFNSIDEPSLLDLYRRSSLLIMPLQDSTANNSILEAMSCGLPIVVTDIGGIRDYVNEDCARFVSPYNPNEMLDTVINLLQSDRERKLMGENARNLAMKFDWAAVKEKYLTLYNHLLNIN